jgi:hypothetical protein
MKDWMANVSTTQSTPLLYEVALTEIHPLQAPSGLEYGRK